MRGRVELSIFALLVMFSGFCSAVGVSFQCKPISTAVFFGSRVHVQCETGYGSNGNILFFALSAATSNDIQQANELQSMGIAAITVGKPLWIFFDDADTSGTAFGCGANDCRRALGVWITR